MTPLTPDPAIRDLSGIAQAIEPGAAKWAAAILLVALVAAVLLNWWTKGDGDD